MTTSTVKTNLLGLTQQEMEKFFDSIGEKRFRAGQVMKWIHHFGVDDFDAMTNVSKALREKLKTVAEVRGPEVVSEDISSDGTRKWVVRVASGSCVETVYIPQGKPHRRRSHRAGVDCQQILWQRPGNRRPCHHQRGDDGHG
jgi:23S rRNA (adenine2503-C2)-methyltransferase